MGVRVQAHRGQLARDLVQALPNLKDISLQDLPPLYDLIEGKLSGIDPSRSLGELVSLHQQIADFILGEGNINLNDYDGVEYSWKYFAFRPNRLSA